MQTLEKPRVSTPCPISLKKPSQWSLRGILVATTLAASSGLSMAVDVPTSYVLRATGSGSLGSFSFFEQPFTLAFEGLGESLSKGFVPYEPGSHPASTWFNQDPLSRIIFSLPSASTITVAQEPGNYSLLGANFGAYLIKPIDNRNRSITVPPFTRFSLCQSGQGQYDCWQSSGQQFFAEKPLDFHLPTEGRVALRPTFPVHFDFMTPRGQLTLSGIENASLQIMPPIPEPETYALMSVGLLGLWAARRRASGLSKPAACSLPWAGA